MKIEGRNSVLEALNSSSVTVNSLTCVKGDNGSVVAQARSQGVKITYVDKSVLDKESASGKHQGYIADIVDYDYCDVSDILACSAEPFVVVLDGINDPHNFGSIIRCCECAGVDGIIIGRKPSGRGYRYGCALLCRSRRARENRTGNQRKQRY